MAGASLNKLLAQVMLSLSFTRVMILMKSNFWWDDGGICV